MTTSKKILYLSYIMAIIGLVVFIYMIFTQNPYCSEMGTVVLALLGEVAVHTACYSSKSKKENSLKIAYGMVRKWADKYGIENVATMFDIVNRE